jgi:sulfide dehydrogenase [flavocytochrome c] flavoprotein chain
MPKTMNARRTLIIGAAASAALAGCASPMRPTRPRVVVVGGGWGGLGAARTLARQGRVDVTLIEPNDSFMSCPLSAHYVAGLNPASDFQRSYAKVDAAGIRRVRDRVSAIDRDRREVIFGAGRMGYDYLVLSPGVEYMEDAVAGYAQARDQLPVGFRAFEQGAVRAQVDRFLTEGGTFVIGVPKPPYRCPPAPYERACLIAEQMKRRGTKGKIILVDANPAPTPPPIAAPLSNAMRELYGNEIEYQTSTDITAVDIARKRLTTSMGEVAFTHANLILPMRAPAMIRQAGLGERWAAVRLPTFMSQADERIYVIGDAQGSPLPKSGHVAFGAGARAAGDILRAVAGTAPPPAAGPASLPDGICWASVTHDQAIMIHVTGTVTPGAAPVLRLKVDPRHNLDSGKAAFDWGRSIWQGMLG